MINNSVADYEVFKRRVRRKTGLDLDAYKQNQMERRLRLAMQRAGANTFQQYYRMLEADEMLMHQFLDRITINVSGLFRNPEHFDCLQNKIMPELLKKTSSLRAWSAGCSYGQEPYSLAICFKETAPWGNYKILATDIDNDALRHAKRGIFKLSDAENISKNHLLRWFAISGKTLIASETLGKMIEFKNMNLLEESFPQNLDLIVCRNVSIYFTDETKSKLYKKFFDSLKAGGYLLVGGSERINDFSEIGYTNPYPFFYKKPD